MPTDSDWKRYSEAGAAREALALLDDHFTDTQAKLDATMFRQLDQGVDLSYEALLQFVHMKHANYTLMRKLEAKLKAGQSAGQRINPLLGAQDA